LLAVICLCAPGLAAEPQSDAKPLQQLASDFWAWRMRYQPFSADDIPRVGYDSATGQREVLVSAQQLTPFGEKKPLIIEDYSWSADLNRLLIFTNSKRVWRANTRGDY